ncbi:hypothetical protein SGGMMB4_03804 [Sodalis glossinidius str. 'morsitans']|uniref:DUF2474 domain-containing protein n=1 Tax=Sodalis glossinidius (strain morsitans) TaxID=343509 RepID=A0A193QJ84_SODGM|nr:hypothetical protein SGGMMB4_02435 [Sodalis glossinidius str. 'morsitans']CRL45765.1 hypothetical protein SGGMMB4_03804 [Sodalis glossinidius str. 'morsitans']
MIKRLPGWKFIMLWLVLFTASTGYLMAAILHAIK